MGEQTIRIIPFTGEEGKWCKRPVKSMARYGIKEKDVLLSEEKKLQGFYELKLINKKTYYEIILAQEDTVCFNIVKEAKTKVNNYGDTR